MHSGWATHPPLSTEILFSQALYCPLINDNQNQQGFLTKKGNAKDPWVFYGFMCWDGII